MQDDLLFQKIILRHLNAPEDITLVEEVEAMRAVSGDHEKLFQDTKRIWEAAAETKRLRGLDLDRAIGKFKNQLGSDDQYKVRKWFSWPRLAAAAVILCAFGIWAYQENSEIRYLVKETNAKIDSVVLNDGTKIMLAENTTINYPERFEDDGRKVTLVKGKAFFSVARDTSRPFAIAIRQSLVTVLGTSFNINYSDTTIELSVKSGKVMFTPNEKSKPAILVANEGINYNYTANTLQAGDGYNANSWITKELHFIDMPLDEVCRELSGYYGVQIILEDKVHSQKKFNANFRDVTLKEALNVLKQTYSVKIQQEDQIIIIKSL